MLALGSKAALVVKSGGGISGLAKGAGLLAVGGEKYSSLNCFSANCFSANSNIDPGRNCRWS